MFMHTFCLYMGGMERVNIHIYYIHACSVHVIYIIVHVLYVCGICTHTHLHHPYVYVAILDF